MCIRQTAGAACASATTCMAPAQVSALTSFTRPAPAARAADMTSGVLVSIDSRTSNSARKISRTGIVLSSSSSTGTGLAPGLVDSPPTSSIRAPSRTICAALNSTLSRSNLNSDRSERASSAPSEKESGVIFKMPIQTGEDSVNCRSPACRMLGVGKSRKLGELVLAGRTTDRS